MRPPCRSRGGEAAAGAGRSIITAATTITPAKARSWTAPEIQAEAAAPSHVPAMPGRPKSATLRQSTIRWRMYGTLPARAITPTTSSEPAMATFSSWPTR